ncbi:alpha/beta hydrolase [Streptacidiphilus sp. PB12-B1b]|uniref:alpha/beta hydrolase n=1 Tax=Streptacidiphilus sp. PB12-B1b TaxID=2705012 RepID=UPI0015FBBDB7|nr:alpha/beta hydrolase [Streptacidiphilus sp. PB12-B1b]QMU77375.1 alpha/beta hydrolase [Streptacidiphilus sp. PB12-B1b]
MTAAPAATRTASWYPPEGLLQRGTLILLPGRGETPGVYERFGRRLAADAYVVHVLDTAPGQDGERTAADIARIAQGAAVPLVLAGSDTGALQALAAAVYPALHADALLLAGTALDADGAPLTDWDSELGARTACPTHRGRLDADAGFTRGSLAEPVPAALADAAERAAAELGSLPVLLLHGEADPVSPVAEARRLAARLPQAVLATVADGRHDALNDISHRSVAATVVQWLERLRGGADLPVVVTVTAPAPAPAPA